MDAMLNSKKKGVQRKNGVRKFTYDNIPLSSQLGRSLLNGSHSEQVLKAARMILDGKEKSAKLEIRRSEVNS